MMSLFLAIHVHPGKRGDGLLPEFLGLASPPRGVPKTMTENPAFSAAEPTATTKPDPQIRRPARKPVVL
ncbi:hypothetical protein [Mesorhizobium silamurunense]|uniref:hypothetical protein n=1 Tax=Mesorhizobium silamurunense TaxID=499528 RepID=UPI0017868AA1|nr:hypothetical protein [Mesorhizobium silamurunense]